MTPEDEKAIRGIIRDELMNVVWPLVVGAVALSLILSFGCGGGSSPTTPTPTPTPNPQPSTWSLSGRVTTTLSGEPVAGATLNFFNVGPVTTNAAGEWTVERPTAITARTFVEVTAPGYVTRRVYVDGSSSSRSGIAIDMIRDTAPFSLGFYRQFVRNDYDTPAQYQWLQRWTRNPSVYVDITNPKGGQLTSDEIESIRQAAIEGIAAFTGGALRLDRFEFGLGRRPETAGWINVQITYEPNGDYCGRSRLGWDPGSIDFNYDRCASECGSEKLGPRTMRHEFGHAMGAWHVAEQSAVMHPDGLTRQPCRATAPSAAELYHARILYARPVGNADLDWDQPTSALAKATGRPAPVVQCYRR